MPRPKRTITRKIKYNDEKEDKDSSMSAASDSDFDEDDDPDKIEVPGGGKDLATAAGINRSEEKPTVNIKPIMKEDNLMLKGEMMQPPKGHPLPNKIPGGLVTKGNMTPGFEVIRGGMGGMSGLGNPFVGLPSAAAAGMLGALGFPSLGYPTMLPPSINTAQFFQQSLDLAGGYPMGLNPFLMQGNSSLLSQLLNQTTMHQGWAGGLPGKTVSQLWMNDESKESQ